MTFSVTEFTPEADFAPGVTAVAGEDGIAVSGALLGSLCNSAPVASAQRARNDVMIRVSLGRRTAVPCPAVVRAIRYDAALTGLEPGSYAVRVVHVPRGLKRNRHEMLVARVEVTASEGGRAPEP